MGNLLQPKRYDMDLFQGVGKGGSSGPYNGIECITWRGGLVAWADER